MILFLTNPIQSSYYISVTLGCGGTSSENCTYFQSGGQEVGQCRLKICPCSDNICQLRLDFQTFVITGPSTGISRWLQGNDLSIPWMLAPPESFFVCKKRQ